MNIKWHGELRYYSMNELRNIIKDSCNDVYFHINNIECGIISEVHNYIPTFEAW